MRNMIIEDLDKLTYKEVGLVYRLVRAILGEDSWSMNEFFVKRLAKQYNLAKYYKGGLKDAK